LTRTS